MDLLELSTRVYIKYPYQELPWIQSAGHMTGMEQVMSDTQDACYSHVTCVPTWSNLARLLAGLGRMILPFPLFV